MNRRNFMQLLGIGGIATLVPAPLFGAEGGPKLWTPGQQKDLAGGHIVLVRPKSSAFKMAPGDTPYYLLDRAKSGKINTSRHGSWPIVTGDVFLTDAGLFNLQRRGEPFPLRLNTEINSERGDGFPPIQVLVPEGRDPHLAFYQAAMKMRDDFKTDSAKLFRNVPGPVRPHAQIVTIVDNPIFAGALWDEDGEGFTVEADYDQYIVNGDINPNGWDVYSEFGEFPIDIPNKIDMDMLLVLDAKVFNGDLKLPRGSRRIIA